MLYPPFVFKFYIHLLYGENQYVPAYRQVLGGQKDIVCHIADIIIFEGLYFQIFGEALLFKNEIHDSLYIKIEPEIALHATTLSMQMHYNRHYI